ncbi:glycerol-3-phosphate phosphatase-like [Aethina tumida]|uniref:glycerol-3-phosphate phosphatase-like n=1 Tax=Aethina tumida TaxID=116153 RepID=UPI0021479164|nr:glycerol-3-phosphate phosphatase-like [Aethina tumida]
MSKKVGFVDICSLESGELLSFLDSIKTIVFACEGVLWYNSKVPIDGALELFNKLSDGGKTIYLVSNNSILSTDELCKVATNMGFKFAMNNIVSSVYLTAKCLRSKKVSKKVYIIGSDGLADELRTIGINSLGPGPDVFSTTVEARLETIEMDQNVEAVVIGLDVHLSYTKLIKAVTYLKDKSCQFIATSAERAVPSNKKVCVPGAGSILRAVEKAAKRNATVVGKPTDFCVEHFKEVVKLNPKTTLMIGSTCHEDVVFGQKCGFYTLLVLTFETVEKLHTYKNIDSNLLPQYYVKSLNKLLDSIK